MDVALSLHRIIEKKRVQSLLIHPRAPSQAWPRRMHSQFAIVEALPPLGSGHSASHALGELHADRKRRRVEIDRAAGSVGSAPIINAPRAA